MAIPLFISARKSEFRSGNAGAGNAGDDALRFRPLNSRDANALTYRVDRLLDGDAKDLHSFNYVLLIVFGIRFAHNFRTEYNHSFLIYSIRKGSQRAPQVCQVHAGFTDDS